MSLTWYARACYLDCFSVVGLNHVNTNWGLVLLLTQKSLFPMLKVDGLIRLMEGENTGPINIGNPGYLYWICNLFPLAVVPALKFFYCQY
jgi:hypothetical protein